MRDFRAPWMARLTFFAILVFSSVANAATYTCEAIVFREPGAVLQPTDILNSYGSGYDWCGPVQASVNGCDMYPLPPEVDFETGQRCYNAPNFDDFYVHGVFTLNLGDPSPGCPNPTQQFTDNGDGTFTCADPPPIPPNPNDPGSPEYCVNKGVAPDTFDQYCGYEQPCPTMTCNSGCQVVHASTDLTGSQFAVFTYQYTGNQCGSGAAQEYANNLPDGMETETTTTTQTETTSAPTTNPDGSTTTTTTTTTTSTTQGTGTGSSGTGLGAAEFGDELAQELTEATPGSSDYTGEMDTEGEAINDSFDQIESDLQDPNDFTGSTNIGLITALIPSSGCSGSISIPIFNSGETLAVTCTDTEELRNVLSWLVALFAAIYIFQLITTKPA